MHRISLIYQLVLLHLITSEANVMVDRLDIPHARVSKPDQLTDFPVLPPLDVNGRFEGFSCAIRTSNLNFSISCAGDLPGIGVVQILTDSRHNGIEDWKDGDGQIGVPRGSVTDDKAYQLARDWLVKAGVDVQAMEKKHRPRVEHLTLPLTNHRIVSSRFAVTWAADKLNRRPAAEVFLNASEKWLVRLHVTDLSYYRNTLPEVPHAIAVSLLPDEPIRSFLRSQASGSATRIFREHGLQLTNVFSLLEKPGKYESEGRIQILHEAKQILSLLDCDQLDEPSENNLTDIYINPPAFGSGGRLEFRNGEMQFDPAGKLRLFRFLPRGQTNHYVWLSTMQSVITDVDAHQIATQKLAALSIDVEKLDRDYKRTFSRGRFYRYDTKGKREYFQTPEYWLSWSDESSSSKPPVVRIAVYGDVKQVGRIELNDTSFWKRSPVVFTNSHAISPQSGAHP